MNALDLALESQRMEAEVEELLLALLPVLDGVERICRGLDRESPETVLARTEALSLLPEMLDQAAGKIGLERSGRCGEPADRLRHEVVDTVPRSDLARGTIVDIVQGGWLFHGRTLRRAKVVASVEAPQDE